MDKVASKDMTEEEAESSIIILGRSYEEREAREGAFPLQVLVAIFRCRATRISTKKVFVAIPGLLADNYSLIFYFHEIETVVGIAPI